MAFTIFDDQTGKGTGDFVATVETLREARRLGWSLLRRDRGYTIFDDSDECAPAVVFVPQPSYVAAQEGAAAFRALTGDTVTACHYLPGSFRRAAWIRGWYEAQAAQRRHEVSLLCEALG